MGPLLSSNSKTSSLLKGVVQMNKVIVHSEDNDNCRQTKFFNGPWSKKRSSMDDSQTPPLMAASSSSLGFSSDSDQDSLHDSCQLSLSFASYDQPAWASMSDQDLLLGIEDAADQDKLVLVSQYLQEMEQRKLTVPDPKRHAILVEHSQLIEKVIQEHQQSPQEGGWKKHCTLHGKQRDTILYSRLNDKQEITIRAETPMEESLLIPLLAVFNETDLYTSWIPSFQRPIKAGMTCSEKLQQSSRACQIARAQLDMPWPFNSRELVLSNVVAEAVDEIGAIVVGVKSIKDGEGHDCGIPPCPPGFDRVGLEGGMMIRKCPKEHPALKKRRQKHKRHGHQEDEEEDLFLFSFIAGVRPSINIVTKTVAGPIWAALLAVAEDVRSGKRPLHKERIESNPLLYGWISEVVDKIKAT